MIQNHNYPPIIISPPRIMMAATTQSASDGVPCPDCNKLSSSIDIQTKYNWSESWKCTNEDCALDIFHSGITLALRGYGIWIKNMLGTSKLYTYIIINLNNLYNKKSNYLVWTLTLPIYVT